MGQKKTNPDDDIILIAGSTGQKPLTKSVLNKKNMEKMRNQGSKKESAHGHGHGHVRSETRDDGQSMPYHNKKAKKYMSQRETEEAVLIRAFGIS